MEFHQKLRGGGWLSVQFERAWLNTKPRDLGGVQIIPSDSTACGATRCDDVTCVGGGAAEHVLGAGQAVGAAVVSGSPVCSLRSLIVADLGSPAASTRAGWDVS